MAEPAWLQEIHEIERRNGGRVRARDVVEWARAHPDSALHSRLEWDDTRAGEQWRLVQARRLLRVRVIREGVSAPAYVSLSVTRQQDGGYQRTSVVLQDRDLRREALADAQRGIRQWLARYRDLEAVSGIVARMESWLDELGSAIDEYDDDDDHIDPPALAGDVDGV
jgi:hypothetical protein